MTLIEALIATVLAGVVGWLVIGHFQGFILGGGLATALILITVVIAVRRVTVHGWG